MNIGAFCATPSVALGRAVGAKACDGDAADGELRSTPRVRARSGWSTASWRRRRSTPSVDELASLIASKSSLAIASGKRVFYQQLDLPLADAYAMAGHAIACDFFSDDGREGVDAFLEKRTPHWKGHPD